jgi:hypothetical protein
VAWRLCQWSGDYVSGLEGMSDLESMSMVWRVCQLSGGYVSYLEGM